MAKPFAANGGQRRLALVQLQNHAPRPVPLPTQKMPPENSAVKGWYNISPVLLLCILWVLVNTFLVDAVTVRMCEQADSGIAKELRMPVFLDQIANDGYMWNHLAEHLGENGQWQVRHTDFDNAPEGREVHWSSGFAWYLRGLGEIYRSSTGDSLRNSIFRMSIWSNPILLVLALAIFTTLSARRFGPLCGSVIAIGMVAVPTFYEGFMPAYPDHHGLIAFTILGVIFGIAWAGAGWIQKPEGGDLVSPRSSRQARHGMIFSAIAGAFGMWISAISMAVILVTIGIAAVVAAGIYGRRLRRDGVVFDSGLWKLWAMWGAGGSVFFYLLEYFPSHLGMRLEVNHPLYALAWLGGGWSIAVLTGWFCEPVVSVNTFPWRKLLWPMAACGLLPLVMVIGQSAVYIPFDPFMEGLWKNIFELQPMAKLIEIGQTSWLAVFGWFPVLLLVSGALLALRQVGSGTKVVLVFLAVPIVLITGLQLMQIRWGMLAGPLYIALAGIVIPQLWRALPAVRWCRVLAFPLLLVFGYQFVAPAFKNRIAGSWEQYRDPRQISFGQGLALLHRQMARTILDSAGGKPVVLLSSPNSSCLLAALGGFQAIGTLYWENVAGLKAAAAGLNAQTEAEALAFMKKHGVTHVSLMNWENFIEPYFNILHPSPDPSVSVMKSFGKAALGDKTIPIWARPLVFPPNDLTVNLKQSVMLLQVVPEQSLNEAKFHLARYVRFVEGKPDQAEAVFKDILASAPESSLVMLELANLYLAQHRYEESVNFLLKAFSDAKPDMRASLAGQVATELGKVGDWSLVAKIARRTAEFGDATSETLHNVAWILATLPTADSRDPQFALSVCDRLERLPHDAVMLTITRAASQAALGDFASAVRLANDVASGVIPADDARRRQAVEMVATFKAEKLWISMR